MKKLLSTLSTFRKEIWSKPSNRDEKRKFCFSPELNREVDMKYSTENLTLRLKDGWREEEPAKIYAAENVCENMEKNIQLLDINGVEIPPEKYAEYWLVVDGQHRLNTWADMMSSCPPEEAKFEIPSVHITLKPGEKLVQYLVEINDRKNWETKQYLQVAAHLNPDNPILSRYSSKLKSSLSRATMEPGKYALRCLNLAYYRSAGAIGKSLAEKIVNKDKYTDIVFPGGYNIERGDRFISICETKFKGIYCGGKELITVFNELSNELGSDDKAFKVFDSLTLSDISLMLVPKTKTKSVLSEPKIREVINKVRERVFGKK